MGRKFHWTVSLTVLERAAWSTRRPGCRSGWMGTRFARLTSRSRTGPSPVRAGRQAGHRWTLRRTRSFPSITNPPLPFGSGGSAYPKRGAGYFFRVSTHSLYFLTLASRSAASAPLVRMYTLIFGSVPEGRTMMEVPSASSKRNTLEPESSMVVFAPVAQSRTLPSA